MRVATQALTRGLGAQAPSSSLPGYKYPGVLHEPQALRQNP